MSPGSDNIRVGLTLGKFAPLHRGHQYLIEKALAETDRLIVMIYDCPDVTDVPLNVRAAWLRDLYPQVEVIEAVGGPQLVGSEPAITAAHDAYIQRLLAGRRVTRFYSGEFYGAHVSRALAAADCRVDPDRQRFPISGTVIRLSPFTHRQWIAPRVYRDLIRNVVFLGAPSTGKTTLCQRLASRYHTQWMPEYGREYLGRTAAGPATEPRAARRYCRRTSRARRAVAPRLGSLSFYRHQCPDDAAIRAPLPRLWSTTVDRVGGCGDVALYDDIPLRRRHSVRGHLGSVR